MYNFVGTNKIGKGSVLEEHIAGDRFVDVGKDSYLGTNTIVSSHAVEGIFGNISFSKVKIGNNFTAAGFDVIGPGVDTGDNSSWLPITVAPKYNIMKGDNFYFGLPIKKLLEKDLMKYLQISGQELKKATGAINIRDLPVKKRKKK
jgi:hypothetical protein